LQATRFYAPSKVEDGTFTAAKPVKFDIPDSIPVIVGNSGRGLVKLSFRNHDGPTFTCQYRGGSRESHPTSDLDVVRARRYVFEGCSVPRGVHDQKGKDEHDRDAKGLRKGWKPGKNLAATWIRLHIESGDSQDPTKQTTVRIGVGTREDGGACEELEDPVPPEESIAIRDAFSWSNTRPVPETDAQGRPSLWYAMIYLQNKDDLESLDTLLIHHSRFPLFFGAGRWQGKCGTFDFRGDGKGVFVYAVIPGAVYNKIREFAVAPAGPEGDGAIFRVLELIDIPDRNARNADGSFSYDFLKRGGFQYRDLQPSDLATNVELQQRPFLSALQKRIRNTVAAVAKVVVRTVVEVIGAIERFAFGSANLRFDLDVLNRDPVLDTSAPIARAWGVIGSEATPRAARVSVHYVSLASVLSLGLGAASAHLLGPENFVLVSPYNGTVDENGRVVIKVPKRLPGGIVCIDVENEAAKFVSFVVTNPHCTFDFVDDLSFLTDDSINIDWRTSDAQMHALTLLTEGADYLHSVVRHKPYRADVLTGPLAAALSAGNGGLAWAPCFGFPSLTLDAILALVRFIPAIGDVAAKFMETFLVSDIVMSPYNADTTDSRVLMTHEYGHYALCSLLYEQAPPDSVITLSDITLAYIASGGGNVGSDQKWRINYEAFADFFAGQVTGGLNYHRPSGGWMESRACVLCNSSPCLEGNTSAATGDTADETLALREIGRLASTFQDAFDGLDPVTGNPTDGDPWQINPAAMTLLQSSPDRYGCRSGIS
jgi:hypothetical protein